MTGGELTRGWIIGIRPLDDAVISCGCRAPSRGFWYLAPLKLGRNFTHRIAVALEPPNDRRDLLGTGLRFSAIFRRKCSP
jgi:hypothetical protein